MGKARGKTPNSTQSISIASDLEFPFTALNLENKVEVEEAFEIEGAERDRDPRDEEEEKGVAVEEELADFAPTSLGRFA